MSLQDRKYFYYWETASKASKGSKNDLLLYQQKLATDSLIEMKR